MSKSSTKLADAYSLQTPQDNINLYSDWSKTYDQGFAQEMDYQLPRNVASIFLELTDGAGPALDVGAGTGLLVESMDGAFSGDIDALDISAEMLEVAASKSLYRETIVGDLTDTLPIKDNSYSAIISSGTFTHGHVGPEGLNELMRVASPDALFVLSVNTKHYKDKGFEEKFRSLDAHMRDFEIRQVRNYGDKADGTHRHDLGNVAIFWKK